MIFVRCYHCECMPSAMKSGLCEQDHCQTAFSSLHQLGISDHKDISSIAKKKKVTWCQVRAVWRIFKTLPSKQLQQGYCQLACVGSFFLSSRNRTSLKRTHDPFPHTASLKCHRVARYISALTVVPHSTNSTSNSPAESHNMTAITLPAE